MLLPLPDYRQKSDFDCGEACARVVSEYHGARLGRKISTPVDGIDPRVLEQALRLAGFHVQSGEATLDDLAHWCRTYRPPIALVRFDGPSHWVVVRGRHGNRVHFHDPDEGPRSVTVAEWESAWHASDGRLSQPFRNWCVVAWPG